MRQAPEITAPGRIVSLILYGSHAHGTATSESDEDWRGVYILPNRDFLGLGVPKMTYEQPPDIVLWELAQFGRMLLKGNPNSVGQLWVPFDCVVIGNWPVTELCVHRQKFITQNMIRAYIGWAKSELGRALTPKQLSHVPRLMWEIKGALEDGEIPVRLPDEKRAVVMSIKTAEMPASEGLALARSLLVEIEAMSRSIKLPDPPYALVEEIVQSARSRRSEPDLLSRRQIDEAKRVVHEEWPDWLRRNRDAVHVGL